MHNYVRFLLELCRENDNRVPIQSIDRFGDADRVTRMSTRSKSIPELNISIYTCILYKNREYLVQDADRYALSLRHVFTLQLIISSGRKMQLVKIDT